MCLLFKSFKIVYIAYLQDMFEKVNKAYEFLCTKSRAVEGPDPQNIVLVLKAQCILFSRYREGKYDLDL